MAIATSMLPRSKPEAPWGTFAPKLLEKELECWLQRASPKIHLHEVCGAVYSLMEGCPHLVEKGIGVSSASQKAIFARIEELASIILIKQEKIQTLQSEVQILREERNRLKHYMDSVNSDGVESLVATPTTNQGSTLVNRVRNDGGNLTSSGIKPGSIKEAVLDVLFRHPNGLIALDILRHINAERDVPLDRTSLSPQLSRLQQSGLIENKKRVWKLVSK